MTVRKYFCTYKKFKQILMQLEDLIDNFKNMREAQLKTLLGLVKIKI